MKNRPPETPTDPLKFRDIKRYADRIRENRLKTGAPTRSLCRSASSSARPSRSAVQDFAFQGGTLGTAAGESIVAGMTLAVERRTPFMIFTASGGARMQEGMFALMQMPRITVAVQRLRQAKLPYIVVLTNPTTGGVTASYAMLVTSMSPSPGRSRFRRRPGDRADHPRTTARGVPARRIFPAHGMVDMVVPRPEMRAALARIRRLRCERLSRRRRERHPEAERGDGCAVVLAG